MVSSCQDDTSTSSMKGIWRSKIARPLMARPHEQFCAVSVSIGNVPDQAVEWRRASWLAPATKMATVRIVTLRPGFFPIAESSVLTPVSLADHRKVVEIDKRVCFGPEPDLAGIAEGPVLHVEHLRAVVSDDEMIAACLHAQRVPGS